MIQLPKTLIKAISEGNQPLSDLEQYLVSNYSIKEILEAFAELLIVSENCVQPPISVTKEEYERIVSLFRIKGQKIVDGVAVAEKRGRKKKTV